jgi:hypothetical protein
MAYLYFDHSFIIPVPIERMRMSVIVNGFVSFKLDTRPTKLFYSNESLAYMRILGD